VELRKDIETGLNVTHGGLNVKPMAISLFNALTGKEEYKGEYPEAGKTLGTFSNRKGTNNYGVPFADLNIFQKIKMDMSRNKELKQYAAELQKQKELKAQIEREAKAAAIERANRPYSGPTYYNRNDDGSRGGAISQDFQNTTASIDNYSSDVLRAKGGLMGRAGSRVRSYFKGGIVSLRGR